MRAMAGSAVAAGVGVLVLMIAATMLSVTFATRGAMATNKPVIEVLHFVGAKNGFIAGHFQRHFLLLGLQGGALGGGVAIAAVRAGRRRSAAGSPAAPAASRARRCSARSRSGFGGYVAVLGQIVLIAAGHRADLASYRQPHARGIDRLRMLAQDVAHAVIGFHVTMAASVAARAPRCCWRWPASSGSSGQIRDRRGDARQQGRRHRGAHRRRHAHSRRHRAAGGRARQAAVDQRACTASTQLQARSRALTPLYAQVFHLLHRPRPLRAQYLRQRASRPSAGRTNTISIRLIVVTSNWHMPRAMVELGHQLPDVTLIPYPVISEK